MRTLTILMATLALTFIGCSDDGGGGGGGGTTDLGADTTGGSDAGGTDVGGGSDPGGMTDPGATADPGATTDPGSGADTGVQDAGADTARDTGGAGDMGGGTDSGGTDTGGPTYDGETCGTAIVIEPGALPYTHDGDSYFATDDYAATGCGLGAGEGVGDIVYSFTPDQSATYVFDISDAEDGSGPVLLYVTTDCADIESACQGFSGDLYWSGGELSVAMEAGTTYFIIVDGLDPSAHADYYTFVASPPCTPSCGAGQCGNDGCGGDCGGCAAGEACQASACVDVSATAGDSCANPKTVGATPFEGTGKTNGLSDVTSWGPAECGMMSGAGGGAPDEAWEISPAVTGHYPIGVESDGFDVALYIVTDCTDVGGTCLQGVDQSGGATEATTALLEQGTTYYVVVDGFILGEEGGYTLTVGEPCIPSCDGKACGDDGCGGSCGECSDPDVCDASVGQCVDPATLAGNSCTTPIVVDAYPYELTTDSTIFTNSASVASDECGTNGSLGGGSNDVVFQLSPSVTGVYTLDVDVTFDAAIYLSTDCASPGSACLDSNDAIGSTATETIVATLDAGTDYFLFVDGWSSSSNLVGPFTVKIGEPCIPSCDGKVCGTDGCGGVCEPGCSDPNVCDPSVGQCVDPASLPANTCASALTVDAVPFSTFGNTTDFTNDFDLAADACGSHTAKGTGANDAVWSFTPATAGVYTITVDPGTGFDPALYVVTTCADAGNSCVAIDTAYSSNAEVLVELDAGVEVFLVIDGNSSSSNEVGEYELIVSEPCIPACGGGTYECGDNGCGSTCGTCEGTDLCDAASQLCVSGETIDGNLCTNPFVVDGSNLPFSGTGDTTTSQNTYATVSGACDGLSGVSGGSAPDHAWEFQPQASGLYTITLTPDGSFDPVLYVVRACDDIENTCFGGDDNVSTPETLDLVLTGGVSYFIIVDGYSSNEGSYTLEVSAPCAPQCDGKQCGDDGCQGTCAPGCADGEYCDDAGMCMTAPTGDQCADPFVIDAAALPWTDTAGDTTPMHNEYGYDGGQCPGDDNAAGGGSSDAVYAFSPQTSGVYTFTVDGSADTFDSAIYVVTDCDAVATSCVGGSESAGSYSDEVLLASLVSGTDYYVIVDGYGTTSNIDGAYTLEVSAPCIPNCASGSAQCGDDDCGLTCGTCTADGTLCNTSTKMCDDVSATPGNACANPQAVGALPFAAATGDTTGKDDLYSHSSGACTGDYSGGSGAPDEAWSFTPAEDGSYSFAVTPFSGWDAAVYVVSDCTAIGDTCLGGNDGSAADTVTVDLTGGTTYFIVVDGSSSGDEGTYSFTAIKNP